MNEMLKPVVEDLVSKFEGEVTEFRGQVSVKVPAEHIVAICQTLRDTHKFEMANNITAVDYWPELTPRFHVVYQFNSFSRKMRLEVRVPLDGNDPVLDSVTSVYPNTNWFERELWDMFGIRIEGHPDPRRILMPHDWEGHPLRKDYPLGYEEVQFTFNYDEILKRKPRPKE
jgi:NADH-quinone oxidoreductase subunit C